MMNGHSFGRRRGRKQSFNESCSARGYPCQINERKENKAPVSYKVLRCPVCHGNVKKYNYISTSIQDSHNWNMEAPTYTSWSDDDFDSSTRGTGVFHPNLALIDNDNVDKESEIPPIDILPDDLQERILASLPLVGLFKACSVCKKWNQIVHSEKFALNDGNALVQKPWYFMFTSSDEKLGYLYDSELGKWYNFDLPFVVQHTWVIATSCGLTCFMDEENGSKMYVCNPITGKCRILKKPSGPGFAVYSALAYSVDRSKRDYRVVVVRSMQASEDFLKWEVAIHVYPSERKTWLPPLMGTMDGWRPGDVSVICNGVLYILLYATRTGEVQSTHGLLAYNLNNQECIDQEPIGLLTESSFTCAPCSLTCARLMNVQDKLVMVGGIGRLDRPGIIRGVGVWVLKGKEWEQITRMPSRFNQKFGEFDDVFASSGSGDLIYVQSYGGTALLVFDMKSKEWYWPLKCPMVKKFPLQIFSGFCFEPNLQILP